MGPYGAYLHDGSEYSGNYMDTMTAEVVILCTHPLTDNARLARVLHTTVFTAHRLLKTGTDLVWQNC